MSLEADQSEDMVLRDFVNKRVILQNESLRKLARHCVSVCNAYQATYTSPPDPDQEEPRALPKFTLQEEVCLAKCEAKVAQMSQVVSRHLEDNFHPNFVRKFVLDFSLP